MVVNEGWSLNRSDKTLYGFGRDALSGEHNTSYKQKKKIKTKRRRRTNENLGVSERIYACFVECNERIRRACGYNVM